MEITRRQLNKILLEMGYEENDPLDPGDGEFTEEEALLLKQLGKDAASEEAREKMMM